MVKRAVQVVASLVVAIPAVAFAANGHPVIDAVQTPDPVLPEAIDANLQAQMLRAPVWQSFVGDAGRGWTAHFRASGIVDHATGPGIRLLESARPAKVELEAAARGFVDSHPALFGVMASELDVVRTRAHADGHAWVLLQQHQQGLPVLDGYVKLHFKGGALVQFGSEAPGSTGALPAAELTAEEAMEAAIRDLQGHGMTVVALQTDVSEAVYEGRRVWVMKLDTRDPRARFETVVDAVTGETLRRRNEIYYSGVRLFGEVEPRQINDPIETVTFIQTSGGVATTNDDGLALADGQFQVSLSGPQARINDQAGADASRTFNLTGGAGIEELYWRNNEAPIEQLDAWHYVNRTIARARFIAPGLSWYDQQLPVNININDSCNAYYDGASLNFFQAGNGCNNTARMIDVVAHEWGHGFHDHQSIAGINAPEIQEGVADYIAVSMTNDPALSPRFFTGGGAIRNVEPDMAYPDDFTGEVHDDGLVWGGAWWDLRKAMIQKYGYAEGRYLTDVLHANVLRGGPDITSAYQDALVADDDDTDVTNGTPNSCEIIAAFGPHGLVDNAVPTSGYLRFEHTPVATGAAEGTAIPVEASISAPTTCGGLDAASVTLHVTTDGGANWQEIPMSASGGAFGATIPGQKAGTLVQYYFSALTDDGSNRLWTEPRRAPRTLHGFYVGSFEDVARWSFESGEGEWTHSANGELLDDWEVGSPAGEGWDPDAAYDGVAVIGNDLAARGGDGLYPENTTSVLTSPVVNCSSCVGTRLHFRRWANTAPGDVIRVRVGDQVVFEDTAGDLHDGMWSYQDLYIGNVADGNPSLQVAFELESNASGTWGGWTLDDIAVVTSAASEGGGPGGGGGGNGPSLTHLDGGCQCSIGSTSTRSPTSLLGLLMVTLGLAVSLRRMWKNSA